MRASHQPALSASQSSWWMLILIRHRIAPAPGEMGYCYMLHSPSPFLPPFPLSSSSSYHYSPYPWGLRTSLAAIPFIRRPLLLAPALMHTRKCPFTHFCLNLLLWGADFDSKVRNLFYPYTKSLEGKSSHIVFPRHLTFVSILLDP